MMAGRPPYPDGAAPPGLEKNAVYEEGQLPSTSTAISGTKDG